MSPTITGSARSAVDALRRLVAGTGLASLAASTLLVACSAEFGSATGPSGSASAPAGTAAVDAGIRGAAPLLGRIVDEDGNAAPGLPVFAFETRSGGTGLATPPILGFNIAATGLEASRSVLEARTGGDGSFRFSGMSEGEFNLEAIRSDEFKVFRSAVRVLRGSSVDVGKLTLARTGTISGRVRSAGDGADLVGTEVYVPGSSYQGRCDAAGNFSISRIAVGSFDLVAAHPTLGRASVQDVTVRPGAVTRPPDIDLVAAPPRVEGLSPDSGGPGALVHISGSGLGDPGKDRVRVTFGGVEARAPMFAEAGGLVVAVPDDARSGDLVVRVGALASAPATFQILGSLSLVPPDIGLLAGGTATAAVVAADTEGLVVRNPAVAWSVDGAAALLAGADRQIRGVAAGVATVEARSGSLLATASIHVFEGSVARVEMSPTEPRAGRLADPFYPRFFNVMSDGATNAYASMEAPEPRDWEAAPSGLLRARLEAGNGKASLRARSVLDPTQEATFAVSIWNDTEVSTQVRGALYRPSAGAGLSLYMPMGVAVGPDGSVLVAEWYRCAAGGGCGGAGEIKRVGTDGTISLVTENFPAGANHRSISAAPDGSFWVSNYGGNTVWRVKADGSMTGITVSGASRADGAVEDAAGSLYVVSSAEHRIFKIEAGGAQSILAGGPPGFADGTGKDARFVSPTCLALAPDGDLLVGDLTRVRRVTPAGHVSTVVGRGGGQIDGPLNEARFSAIKSLAIEPDGGIIVADGARIRRISPAGFVTTLAGTGQGRGLDGPGRLATFGNPMGVAVDGRGSLFVADTGYDGFYQALRRVRLFPGGI